MRASRERLRFSGAHVSFAAGMRTRLTLLLLGLMAGCTPGGGDLDTNPDYAQARKAVAAGDFHLAANAYEKLLGEAPQAARLHLELAQLYEEKLSDPLPAIYHYRQYVRLEPNAERRQVVENFIGRAQLALAAKLPTAPGTEPGELVRLQTEKAALMQENASLRLRVTELENLMKTPPTVPPPEMPGTQTVATPVPPAPAALRTHVVQKGDTLYSLAIRFYGSRSAWAKIFEANRGTLSNKDQLKVGQQLVIP